MKLRALELEQFRKFTRPVRVAGFGDRVNVLCGPNEFGKSTILVAIRGLLFERYSSKADPIKRMQSWRGNAAPRLAMEFETGGGVWRIEKRFLHQPMARLTGPDGSRFDNDAAEETLQRLLGFGASGKQGAKPDQMGMWGALWVAQRESMVQADLTSDLARATINSCLDTEVGVLTGNEKGKQLIRKVREQRAQLVDGNGKPKGRHREVTEALQAAANTLAGLRDRAQRLAEDAVEFRRCSDLLARESDPAADARDREALADAQRRREQALLHRQTLLAAQAALDLAERHLQEAARERQQRVERAEALAARRTALERERGIAEQARGVMEQADAVLAGHRDAAQAAQERALKAAAEVRRLRAVLDVVRKAEVMSGLQTVLKQAEAAQAEVNERGARLAAMRVDRDRIDAIRKAQRERDGARFALDAQATQVAIDLLPAAAGLVTVGGARFDPALSPLVIVDDTEIVIGGVGRINVLPAARDRDKLRKRLETAEQRLGALLIEADCSDAADAERRHAEREGMERSLGDARATLDRLVPGDAKDGLAPGIGALREHVDVTQRLVQQEVARWGLDRLPLGADVAEELAAADAEEGAASEALVQARADRDGAMERRSDAHDAFGRAEAAAKQADLEVVRLAGDADAAERLEPNESLDQRLAMAEQECERCRREVAVLMQNGPHDTVEGMQARIERYQQAIELRQQTIGRLRLTIAETRARIAQEGGHGLDEQIAGKEREQDALSLEQTNIRRELEVLDLLLETLLSAEKQTKERYLAPVVRRVTPYLRGLFPGADITCDDQLRITGVTRDLAGMEDFDRLSDGTQEQIAVLSRLAFAEMLIDRGKPAMVILDDALAFSDAERLERMFDVLTQASAKMQILVLTCRQDLFARLGGNRLEVMQAEAALSQALNDRPYRAALPP